MHPVETYRGFVYPWEIDHNGHLNVQHYARRFDEATWHFFHAVGLTQAHLSASKRGMVALEQHIRYLREVHAGAMLVVRSHPLEIKAKTVRFLHRMVDLGAGAVVSESELTGAYFDLDERRAAAFPEGLPRLLPLT